MQVCNSSSGLRTWRLRSLAVRAGTRQFPDAESVAVASGPAATCCPAPTVTVPVRPDYILQCGADGYDLVGWNGRPFTVQRIGGGAVPVFLLFEGPNTVQPITGAPIQTVTPPAGTTGLKYYSNCDGFYNLPLICGRTNVPMTWYAGYTLVNITAGPMTVTLTEAYPGSGSNGPSPSILLAADTSQNISGYATFTTTC
jgi:hypothetical protein